MIDLNVPTQHGGEFMIKRRIAESPQKILNPQYNSRDESIDDPLTVLISMHRNDLRLRDFRSAERARGMRAQPQINALGMVAVPALPQFPVTIAAADVVQAYGATLAALVINGGGRTAVFDAVEFLEEV